MKAKRVRSKSGIDKLKLGDHFIIDVLPKDPEKVTQEQIDKFDELVAYSEARAEKIKNDGIKR